jgi:tetratricopeptide (TPR) repeat protein
MDPSEIDMLVRRLVDNPHDEEALAYAHQAGASDPKSYAMLLEKVGNETTDPAYSSHWLSEAANVWVTALGDAHRAARVLMTAIDRDPTQHVAAERLAQLYRDKGDVKALAALLDRRAKALAPLLHGNPELRNELAGMHEELGRLWAEAPLSQPKKAVEHYRRAVELDPTSAYAIFNARELLKQLAQYEDAIPLYDAERQLDADPARQVGLYRDEAATRKLAGDLAGASACLALARQLDPEDPGLQQEYAASVLDRLQAGENVPPEERTGAADLLVALAEVYDGEHGLAYSGGALDLDPGHDRAMQLFVYYARTLQRDAELGPRFGPYLAANPNGSMAGEARQAGYEASAAPPPVARREPAPAPQPPPPERREESAAVERPLMEFNAPAARAPATGASAVVDPVAMEAGPRRVSGLAPDRLQGVLDAAQMLANKGKRAEAYAKYREVLDADAAQPEALSWAEDYLRTKRDYAALRDVLLASVRAVGGTKESLDTRRERLREIAGICEGNLRDVDGAVAALKQLLVLDRGDDSARQSLTRILEKAQRWDDLANLLESEASAAPDIDTKIALEKKLAGLHEQKRRDFVAAAEAWARIARLAPEDDRAVSTAAKLFEKGGQLEQAAQVIADSATSIEDPVARGQLLERLGEIREQAGEFAAAGEAFADAAEAQRSAKLWDAAERCFASAERWDRAAFAASQRGQLGGDSKLEAQHYARAAEHFARAGDEAGALEKLEQAAELDPIADDYATALTERYSAAGSWEKLVLLLAKRGERLSDKGKRIAQRRQAAQLYATKLLDKEAAREQWLKVLDDGDDREALEHLVDYAIEREDHTEATTLLRRLGAIAVDKADKARVALREAELLAEGIGDVDTAIVRYESVLAELDPTCRPALQAIADLQEARDNFLAAAEALERELKLVADADERGQIATRLARLYEKLDDPRQAIRALEIVRKADPDDFDALERLCELSEKIEQWDRVAELLAQRIEVQADESEAAEMTLKLATILADRLSRGDEALAALTEFADQGNASLRAAYVELGDRLGWKGLVAQKLVEWWLDARSGPERTAALRGAFDRFSEVGRQKDAARVAMEIVRAKGADRGLAQRLEELASQTNDHDALYVAQDLLLRDLSGTERASELVRQAEARVAAGVPRGEAMSHGEQGLLAVAPSEAEPLLERLSALAEKPLDVVELYERQVSRSKLPADRMRALARAAQVAAARGIPDRARTFFELALAGLPTEETLTALEEAASAGDRVTGGEKLRRALCAAFTSSGGGARDGGRTRASLLRRAAGVAFRDLRDVDQAFAWMADALVAHVDPSTLDALEQLARDVGDMTRAEAAVSHALTEVFDGPLVRQLLGRRAKLRRTELGDRAGAAADLKKLHDLSPTDAAVMEDLSGLLTELGDYRGMVQLYEDQILRGKDMNARAELARKVARMWEEQLQDPREAADAWRRVLRMRAGDPEATAGLERAKTNMLKKPDPDAPADQYAPPKPTAPPPAPPETNTAKTAPPSSAARVDKSTPPAPAMVPTPAAAFIPPRDLDMPTDTGSIVAALVDTSETPAEVPLPPAAIPPPVERAPDSEHPTIALGMAEVQALTRGLGPRQTEFSESTSTARTGIMPTSGPSTQRGVQPPSPPETLSATDERPAMALDFNDETIARPIDPDASSEVVDIDELAVDVEDEDPKPRSIPPPLPRS